MLKKQKLKRVCNSQLDVLPHISIQEFRQPDSESFVFYLTAERPEERAVEEVFSLLLEREEYAEAGWEWNRAAIEKNRAVLTNILEPVIEHGVFSEIDGASVLQRILTYENNGIQIDERLFIDESRHVVIYNEWNLFLVFGYEGTTAYLYTWFTTA
ncbi:hypothetical protein MOB40_11930 [Bacillus inaquosorum]|uniref:hypothetical protein n=1 Tax=Bacillus inaquosorum TaxID=483913 RepID=UPI000E7307D8|nr:hypothetical protein [Bacillus inaquosorum]RKQ24667.1 hypothetical protein D3797_000780 [Bacillus subtilis]MCY7905611.1 hypothetical protein [Bacillus inaquosorum]MCY7929511.1 hypothetical protein [Bacillus inaquosorum]MCY7953113.1 hypothetical protein [Bacillus inaquosorum]MCY8028959.1 hypothetical protein [Bacillus inaquosorum]